MKDIKKAIEEEIGRYLYKTDGWTTKRCSMEYISNFILSKWEESTRWRKVEEELPDDNITVLLEIEYDGITDCSTGHFYDKGKKYHLDSELYKDAIITCWKPIH